MSAWIRSYECRIDYLEHLDGVDWYHARLPRRRHHCQPQTRGFLGFGYVERCACGAIRDRANGSWLERNSRKKKQR